MIPLAGFVKVYEICTNPSSFFKIKPITSLVGVEKTVPSQRVPMTLIGPQPTPFFSPKPKRIASLIRFDEDPSQCMMVGPRIVEGDQGPEPAFLPVPVLGIASGILEGGVNDDIDFKSFLVA